MNAYSPQQQQPVSLSAGNNTIAVPSQAAGVIIIPPAGSTVALTLKGVNADTGIALGPQGLTVLSFTNPPPASIVINAGSTVVVQVIFF